MTEKFIDYNGLFLCKYRQKLVRYFYCCTTKINVTQVAMYINRQSRKKTIEKFFGANSQYQLYLISLWYVLSILLGGDLNLEMIILLYQNRNIAS